MNKDQINEKDIILMKGVGELTSEINEKSEVKEKKFQLSSFDKFGASPSVSWNGGTYNTKTGLIFTLFYYVLTFYLLWLSLEKFIALDSANVTYGNFDEVIQASDNINLINSTFPYVTFYEYTDSDDYTPVIDAEDVLCNFKVAGLKKNFVGQLGVLSDNGASESAGNYCANHLTSTTENGETKTSYPNGYEVSGTSNREEIIRRGGICFESSNIHLFGEPVEECTQKGECQYYSMTFEYKSASERASCSRSIDIENTVVSIKMLDNVLTPSDYSSPWGFENKLIHFYLLSDQGIDVTLYFTKLQLTTTAMDFDVGLSSAGVSTKLNLKNHESILYNNESSISLNINFMLGFKHVGVDRTYINFFDALSYYGGLKGYVIWIVAIQYTNYLKRRFGKDLIHKGIMITGKLGQNESSVKYLEDVYDKKVFYEPKFDFSTKFLKCRKKANVNLENKEAEENEKITDEAFKNILSRQTDQKHIFQLFQDVELIKKVIFEERHLVLASLVTVECEKNKLVSKKNKESEKEMKSYVNQYHDDGTFVNKIKESNHTKVTKSYQLGQKSESDRKIINETKTILNEEKESNKFQQDAYEDLPDNVENLESFRDLNVPIESKVNKLIDCFVAEQRKRESLEKKIYKVKNMVDFLEEQLRSKNPNSNKDGFDKVDDQEEAKKQSLQSNFEEDEPYAISREYMSDVYQAIERGKLENTMYFKRILVNSVKQLKYKPKCLKTSIEEKVDQQFMDFLPDSIQNCEKILELPCTKLKLGQHSDVNNNTADGFNKELLFKNITESKVQLEINKPNRCIKQEVSSSKISEIQILDDSSNKLEVGNNEYGVEFDQFNLEEEIDPVKRNQSNKSKIDANIL